MTEYRLFTVWHIAAPLDQVCAAIEHSLRWPTWWECVEAAEEIEPGDERGIGSLRRYTCKGRLPYRLTFDFRVTRAEPRVMVEGIASGEVQGFGRWRFVEQSPIILVHHEWDVCTTKLWMNLLAPVARPLFAWNHRYVMHRGEEGLARLLNNAQQQSAK